MLNVTDGAPLTRRAYYATLADLLGGPPPAFTGAGGRVGGLGKRVRADRVRATLDWSPRFPTAAAGLGQALQTEPG